jgi:ribosome-binding protein aMBF1 (putative translation factor)
VGAVVQLAGDDRAIRSATETTNRGAERLIEAERVNADIAQMIYDARIQAGLTQEELAKRVGTKQPVIARLEDADYQGHSLNMLQRIAKALNRTLRVEMPQAAAR